jgi:hypothetical protein
MDAALELIRSRYRGWTLRARTIRGELDRWRLYALALTVAGAVLTSRPPSFPEGSRDRQGPRASSAHRAL